MASNKRTIHLGLDYSEFTGGISEVNRKMQLLDAEFKLAQEQAKNYGTETDKLGVKQEYLTQKIALQNKKLEEAKKAYDAALVKGSKASQKEIDALDKKLLQERITLEKLTGQLSKTDDEMEDLSNSTESFGDQIRNVASSLGLEVSPALENLSKKFDGVSKDVGNAVLGLGALIGTLVKTTLETTKLAGEIDELSHKTGLTTDQIQELNYAAEYLEVSAEDIGSSMAKMTRNMDAARNGTGEAAEAFKKLGVRVKDSKGNLRDSQEVFYDVIDALGRVKNSTEKNALSMSIFGRSAMDLNNLIIEGSEGLKGYAKEAHEMGYVMDNETINSFNKLDDAMVKFGKVTESLQNSFATALLPMLTALFEAISKIPAPVLKTMVVLAGIVASVVLVVKAIKSVTDTGKSIKGFFDTVNPMTLKTTAIILGVVAALIALVTVIAVLAGKGNDLQKSMQTVSDSVGNINNTVAKTQTNVRTVSNHANGTRNYLGGETWVGESGPEIVRLPRGSQIIDANESKKMSGTVINNYYNTIQAKDIKEFNDIVRIVQGQQSAYRRGVRVNV